MEFEFNHGLENGYEVKYSTFQLISVFFNEKDCIIETMLRKLVEDKAAVVIF